MPKPRLHDPGSVAPQPFHFRLVGEKREFVTREAIIPDLMWPGDIVVVYGEAGTGKSALAADIAVRLDAGLPIFGRPVERASVLYLAGERDDLTDERMAVASGLFGIETKVALVAGRLDRLGVVGLSERLSATMRQVEERTQERCRIVVIDTLGRCFPGVDENSGRDINALVDELSSMARLEGAAVILITHEGKASTGIRGHTAIIGAADLAIRVVEQKAIRVAKIEKANAMPEGGTFRFRLVGSPAGSLLVEHLIDGEPYAGLSDDRPAAMRGGAKALLAIIEETGPCSVETARSAFYGTMGNKPSDTKRRAFYDARKALEQAGFIEAGTEEIIVREREEA